MYIPLNIKKFLFDYENSKFYECNKTVAKDIINLMGSNHTQNMTHNDRILNGFKYFSTTMESLYIKYTLTAGTLLGK